MTQEQPGSTVTTCRAPPPAPMPARRRLAVVAANPRGAIYGTIVACAVIAATAAGGKSSALILTATVATLLVFWLLPGFDHETFIFGAAHGLGYVALCLLIFFTIVRRQAPWPLLAATLTPVGPFGSVIAIEVIERRELGIAGSP